VKDEGGAGEDVQELKPGHSKALCLELQVLCSRQSWNTNFSPTINRYGQERVIMYNNSADPCFVKTGLSTTHFEPVFWIRIRIHRIHVFFGLPDPDPDPLVRGMDPDPSIIMQK
jgi:hypothetical protein